jgi:hypothetical protein
MMFFCESALEAQRAGTRAAANKSKHGRACGAGFQLIRRIAHHHGQARANTSSRFLQTHLPVDCKDVFPFTAKVCIRFCDRGRRAAATYILPSVAKLYAWELRVPDLQYART